MEYVWFSLGFSLIHLGAYVLAGIAALSFSRDLYTGGDAALTEFLRDVDQPQERKRQGLVMFPAQIARAVLMSVVLYPLLEAIGALTYPVRFTFLTGLMLVYTDIAAATPFPNTIEGLVYLQRRFVTRSSFWKIQSEAIVYSLFFGSSAAWLLF